MTTDPSNHSPTTSHRPASKGVRLPRLIARTVVVLDGIVLLVAAARLGFVDINEHPGLVTTIWITIPIFVVAFPFMGFRDASPGNRHHRPPTDE